MKSKYIIPIFVPHVGCPNQCIFCNQKKISGQIKELTGEEVTKQIEEYLEVNKNANYTDIEVAFYGGSFTGIEHEKQIEFLKIAYDFVVNKKIGSIRLSTRPDYIDQEILDYLKQYGVRTIELGVQSMKDIVLDRSKRGHNRQQVIDASNLINSNGFDLGLQMMVGLPESNEQEEIETANEIIKLKPKCVRIYPVLVIKDTPLEEEYLQGKYMPYTIQRAVDISTKLLEMFEKENITVIRIGLQTTDNINEGKDVVAGPFHPAFGELVKQKIVYNKIEKFIAANNLSDCSINITCNNKDVSKIVGNKKENVLKIKKKFNIDINLNINDNIKTGEYIIIKDRS